jgi:peptidoglycan biosynthesis protein MviN/MurJ (putative lipid II flippase)
MRSRTGLMLAAISLTTTSLGLLGQLLLFHYFGAGRLLDLYFYSLAMPSFIAGQIGLVFSYYLVPYLLRQSTMADRMELARGLMLAVGLINLGLMLPGIALGAEFAPHGLGNSGLAWLLSTLAWSSVMLANISAVQGALLNSESRFVTSSLLALLPQAGAMIALVASGGRHIGWALAGLNAGSLLALWLGRVRGPSLPASGAPSLRSSLLSAARFARQASVVPLALSIFSAHFFIDALLSWQLPAGDLSLLALAHRVLIGGIGVVVAAFGNPMTTALAQVEGTSKEAFALLAGYLKRIFIYGLAIAAAVSAYAPDLSALLLTSRSNSQEASQGLSQVMRILAAAAVPMLLGQILMRALMAWHRQQAAVIGAACWLAAYLPCAFFLSGRLGASGLALTYFLAWSTLCLVALWQAGTLRLLRWRHVAQLLGYGSGLAAIAVGSHRLLTQLLPDTQSLLTSVSIIGVITALTGAWAVAVDRRMWRSTAR